VGVYCVVAVPIGWTVALTGANTQITEKVCNCAMHQGSYGFESFN
jgi:hypothetical protein